MHRDAPVDMPAGVVRSFNRIRQMVPTTQEWTAHDGTHSIIYCVVQKSGTLLVFEFPTLLDALQLQF